MKPSVRLLLGLVSLLIVVSGLWAEDLRKIDRSLAREPAYRSKPQYCLLVFGPEAKIRVWIVLDGDVAYIDRNANGDLTENGNRLEVKRENAKDRVTSLGTITTSGGTESYRILYLDREQIWIEVRDGFDQYAPLSYADRPQDAPVFHFDGPLAMMPSPADIKNGLIRGKPDNLFRVLIGTRTSEKGVVFVECDQSYPDKKLRAPSRGLPKNVHPVVTIEFPGTSHPEKPITCTYTFDRRC
jgi:hypothetical protein